MYRLPFLLLSFCFILLSTSACSPRQHLATVATGQSIDQRLVGTWSGSEADDQVKGMQKSWTMARTADGSFTLDFRVTYDNRPSEQFIETGRWWIADGLFHEFHDISGQTDIYAYKILNKQQVRFSAQALSGGGDHDDDTYVFVDTKVGK
ncbi:MAG: hypothetical protein AB8H12_20835 [Lewinella sp.]